MEICSLFMSSTHGSWCFKTHFSDFASCHDSLRYMVCVLLQTSGCWDFKTWLSITWRCIVSIKEQGLYEVGDSGDTNEETEDRWVVENYSCLTLFDQMGEKTENKVEEIIMTPFVLGFLRWHQNSGLLEKVTHVWAWFITRIFKASLPFIQ